MNHELYEQIRSQVAAGLSQAAAAGGGAGVTAGQRRELAWHLLEEVLDRHAAAELAAGRQPPTAQQEKQLAAAVHDSLFGLGGFQPLLDDPRVENINANGAGNVWVRLADGRREQAAPVAADDRELTELIRTAAARLGVGERRFDLGAPALSMQLPDGSRLFAVMAVTGVPCVSIRRHRHIVVSLGELVRAGTLTPELAMFVRALVRARKNIVVCGGTGAGKTTLLRALAAEIPPAERLITVEDSLELALDRDSQAHPDVVAMQARDANTEGEGEITCADLVRWALRMSPDRVIVGEVRGAEVVPMLNAMSQGNDGSMCTLHASSSRGAFTKLATYAVQAPERLPLEATNLLVASAVDFVVHLDHDGSGRRVVSSVREVTDADGTQVASNEIWRPGPDGHAVPAAPLRTATMDQLIDAGYRP